MNKKSTLAAIAATALGLGALAEANAQSGVAISRAEFEAFRSAVRSNDADGYSEFLRRYPLSPFAREAFDEVVRRTGAPPLEFDNFEEMQSAAIY